MAMQISPMLPELDMTQPDAPNILSKPRAEAASRFAAFGWPDKSVEAFKFTPLDRLSGKTLLVASGPENAPDDTSKTVMAGATHIRIRSGLYDAGANEAGGGDAMPAGVKLSLLSDDTDRQAQLLAELPKTHPVANLSFARMSAGLVLQVSRDARPEAALVLDFSGGDAETAAFPVILIEMEAGSHLRLVEHHHSAHGLSAPLLLLRLAERAELHHVRLQDEAAGSDFVALTQIHMGAQAKLNSFTVSKGAGLARCETHAELLGEYGEVDLSHIYLGADAQILDITTKLNHAMPFGRSNQLIRGVLDDKARGVFQGKVRVAPDAQKTDGQQMSRALLLSREAEADAKPELEIFADDVVCSHGATVGELDETQLFYLESRGIPEAEARALLIAAFLIDGLEQIKDPELASWLSASVHDWPKKLLTRATG